MMSTNNILSPSNGSPIINPSQDIVLGLYYLTTARSFQLGEGMTFSDSAEVIAAYDHGAIGLHARIKVRVAGEIVETTTGRIIVSELIPSKVPFDKVNCVLNKKNIAALVTGAYRTAGTKATVILCDRIKDLGYEYATRAGVTIGVKDLKIPVAKAGLLDSAHNEVEEIENQFQDGIITRTEKYNKVVDVWTKTTNEISNEMMQEMSTDVLTDPKTGKTEVNSSFNPIYMMATSGARGNQDQMRQLAGMRGLMAKPSGEIIETPITASFREGLSVLQYFISTHGARKGLADTALKTANSGYLTRRLVDVVQDVTVSEIDCGTVDGLELGHFMKGGEIKQRLAERVQGRVTMFDIYNEDTGELIIPANTVINSAYAAALDASDVSSINIRSGLTCKSKQGICAMCYGRDLARGHLVNVGETVGIIAAQSIGEPGTQLTMRTFHIGGTASKEIESSNIESQHNGRVVTSRMRTVVNSEGHKMVLGKSCQVSIVDEQGREREKYVLPSGSRLLVEEGMDVKKGTALAEWDPYMEPFIVDVSGDIKFKDIIEGKTVQEDRTSKASFTIMEYRTTNYRPSVGILAEDGTAVQRPGTDIDANFAMPVGAIMMVKDGATVRAGDVIARKPRESSKTKDIVGGLPRVAELFEVRKPKDMGVVSSIDGIVTFGAETKGKRKVIVTPETGDTKEFLIPKGKHITVQEADFVEAGDLLTEGNPELHDILRIKGEKHLARYLVEEIQDVYRFQGVNINDKHIEIIVRQMLKKVSILEPGSTSFLIGEQVDKLRFMNENSKIMAEGGNPAVAETLVLGITQASLSTDSFISAASFQETTKVLTEASLKGKCDYLRGLKENVIVGRLVPAGTGFRKYTEAGISVPDQLERPDKFLEDLEENPLLVDTAE